MNKIEELKAKIEQNTVECKMLGRESCRLAIELETAEKKTEEPELKPLDWGCIDGTNLRFFTKDNGIFKAYDINGICYNSNVLECMAWKDGRIKIKGNLKDIFLDLEAISEPLEEFEIKPDMNDCQSNQSINVVNYRSHKCFTVEDKYTEQKIHFHLSASQFDELILNLRRMQAGIGGAK